jgi:hypothetical protein
MMILHSEEESRNGGATLSQLISDIKRCAQIKNVSGIQGYFLHLLYISIIAYPELCLRTFL